MGEKPDSMDSNTGFIHKTKSFHSLRPAVPLPPPSQPLSIAQFCLSNSSDSTFLIDSATDHRLTFSELLHQTRSLALHLRQTFSLSSGHVAFLLCPYSPRVPVLYFALLSIGVVVSPANPIASESELRHQLRISQPVIAFATARTKRKLPILLGTVLIDSPEFDSVLSGSVVAEVKQSDHPTAVVDSLEFDSVLDRRSGHTDPQQQPHHHQIYDPTNRASQRSGYDLVLDRRSGSGDGAADPAIVEFDWVLDRRSGGAVKQSDPAMIMYSSGTTGMVKGVVLTHRNLVALVAVLRFNKEAEGKMDHRKVSILLAPLFHVIGLLVLLKAVALGETLVAMERFDLEGMLRAVERYRVRVLTVSPPIVVALVKSELVGKYDLSSLQDVTCGGAPLGRAAVERFRERFPSVMIGQGYGLTETTAGVARMTTPEEYERHGSVGRLVSNLEAKIVDPDTGEALPAGRTGELWCRGPTVMKGYVGNDKATAETLTSEGWLKTGDICYFDSEGFLYVVDRLKELIKYKAYQVPPAELEHLLQSMPEIADAAVIPYPDEDAGQIPMAYVVRKPGSNINAVQIMESITKQVAPYKKIRRVTFIDSIPKNPAGKILRRELVRHAVSNTTPKL